MNARENENDDQRLKVRRSSGSAAGRSLAETDTCSDMSMTASR